MRKQTLCIVIDIPEGYEDVNEELILEDFLKSPNASCWSVRLDQIAEILERGMG